MAANGLVLVFDIDQTLSGEYFNPLNNPENKEPILNERLVSLLKEAVAARKPSGTVTAIFILTNNGDGPFITLIQKAYDEKVGTPNVFENTLSSRDESRTREIEEDLTSRLGKGLKDVKFMMDQVGKSTDNLASRVFFFDDMEHLMRQELTDPRQYIKITPPFDGVALDLTDVSFVLSKIRGQKTGGKRKRTRKTRRRTRRGKRRA
jgi:hypothetical protein